MKTDIFVRVGVILNTTDNDVKELINGNGEVLKRLLEDKKYIFGDTYISADTIEEYNEKYGTSHNCDCDVTIDM